MKKEFFLLAAGIAVAAAIIFFVFFAGTETANDSGAAPGAAQKTNFLLEQRASYGLSPAIFSGLPAPPNDFNTIVPLYREGKFRDEFFFSEKYFLQPEFYPSFTRNGLAYWLNPDTTHYGAYGYGSYPLKKTVFIKAGESASARFFMHSGYGVRSFQGVLLEASVGGSGGEGRNFFDVEIKGPAFLLGPSFPKFERNWAKGIILEVSSATGTPASTYTIKVTASAPPLELSNKWRSESPGKYFDAGFVSPERPVFEMEIIVG